MTILTGNNVHFLIMKNARKRLFPTFVQTLVLNMTSFCTVSKGKCCHSELSLQLQIKKWVSFWYLFQAHCVYRSLEWLKMSKKLNSFLKPILKDISLEVVALLTYPDVFGWNSLQRSNLKSRSERASAFPYDFCTTQGLKGA